MGNQRTFASMAWNGKGKVTRRERFLAEMEAGIPWPRLVRLIEPHYPKAGQGRQPLGLEKHQPIGLPTLHPLELLDDCLV
jgi:IS5 family transposase